MPVPVLQLLLGATAVVVLGTLKALTLDRGGTDTAGTVSAAGTVIKLVLMALLPAATATIESVEGVRAPREEEPNLLDAGTGFGTVRPPAAALLLTLPLTLPLLPLLLMMALATEEEDEEEEADAMATGFREGSVGTEESKASTCIS